MAFDLYIEQTSFFHRLDPRTKILLLLATFVLFLMADTPAAFLSLWAFLILQGIMTRAMSLMNRFKILLGAVLILATATKGWEAGLTMDGMIVGGLFFLASTRPEEVLQGLLQMGLPYPVGFALSMAVRLVPVFLESAETVTLAQRSRGLRLDRGSLLERLRKHLPLFVPILVSAVRGANLLSFALEARGYGSGRPRTAWLQSRWKRVDAAVLLLILFLIILFFLIKSP